MHIFYFFVWFGIDLLIIGVHIGEALAMLRRRIDLGESKMNIEMLKRIDSAIKESGGFITVSSRAVCAIQKPWGSLIKARANGKINEGESPIFKISEGGQTISNMSYIKKRKAKDADFVQGETWHKPLEGHGSLVCHKAKESSVYLRTVYDAEHKLARPSVSFEWEDGSKLDSDMAAMVKVKIAKKDSNPNPVRVYKPATLTRVAVGGKVFTA